MIKCIEKKHLKVAFDEIDEMIATVDRNGDGRISYSEFRSFKKI